MAAGWLYVSGPGAVAAAVIIFERRVRGEASALLGCEKLSGGRAVHPALAGDEPVDAEVGVAPEYSGEEVEARLVASRENVGDACAGYAEAVGELSLGDVLCGEELLESYSCLFIGICHTVNF